MAKDRKTKARALGAAVGVSTAVITGVAVALALSFGGAPARPADSVLYPSDMPHDASMSAHGMEDMGEPPAP